MEAYKRDLKKKKKKKKRVGVYFAIFSTLSVQTITTMLLQAIVKTGKNYI